METYPKWKNVKVPWDHTINRFFILINLIFNSLNNGLQISYTYRLCM